jgi:hypothetical protein
MKNLFIIFIAVFLAGSSCTKNEFKIDRNNPLIGTWNLSRVDTAGVIYSRAVNFTQAPGYRFGSDGSVTERNIAGWCATPPVSYSDYSGSWSIVNSEVIRIERTNYDDLPRSYTVKYRLFSIDSLKVYPMNK